ncbi:MAG: hypothetical protein RSD88_06970 [Anaerovoracaceae bacterium]
MNNNLKTAINEYFKDAIMHEKNEIEILEANADLIKIINRRIAWIPVSEGLPDGEINPITQDFYEYEVTVNICGLVDVRNYKFGRGHWLDGPEAVDKYVIAWRERPEPYKEVN